MDAAQELLQKLKTNLEELAKIYAQLLELVLAERELLVAADISRLNAHNETKESVLLKARFADMNRMKIAEELVKRIGGDSANPRLLEIAQKVGGVDAIFLRDMHKNLDATIRKINEANKENEEYTRSALRMLDGAMSDLKSSIAGKKTYGGKGKYKLGPEIAGNFVSKEA